MKPDRLAQITVDPKQCGGRPCVRGYRIRVTDILELLASGATHEEILVDYPFLEAADIYAVLEYAATRPTIPWSGLRQFTETAFQEDNTSEHRSLSKK